MSCGVEMALSTRGLRRTCVAGSRNMRGRGARARNLYEAGGRSIFVFQTVIGSRDLALRVEGAIKRLPKAQKEELTVQESMIDRLIDLARAGLSRRGISRREIGTRARRSWPAVAL
jgi:hypothetical protein